MIRLFNAFVKLTGLPAALLVFRTKVYYENKAAQGRRIKGAAVLVSNHTSVFDYAVYLFVFFSRTLRYQMAEVLFKKPGLGLLLKCLGGIRVDRGAHDFGFMPKSERILERGGVVGIFPESRLPLPGETRPLPFKVSAAYLALTSGAKIVPVVTNGSYFNRKRARVLIGKPIHAAELLEEGVTEKENLAIVSERLRERIVALEKLLYGTETNESR